MYKYLLAEGGDINWMALFALLTFFLIFSISLYAIFSKKGSMYDHMANLPLENDNINEKSLAEYEK